MPFLTTLVPRNWFLEACEQAAADLEAFERAHDIRLTSLLLSPRTKHLNTRAVWAVRFAQEIGGVDQIVKWRVLPKGFGSWLMVVDGESAIAVDSKQIRAWTRRAKRVRQLDVQVARAILHELGHIQLTPYLISSKIVKQSKSTGEVRSADPEDEVKPWVYVFALMGYLLAGYARQARVDRKIEDTPSIPV